MPKHTEAKVGKYLSCAVGLMLIGATVWFALQNRDLEAQLVHYRAVIRTREQKLTQCMEELSLDEDQLAKLKSKISESTVLTNWRKNSRSTDYWFTKKIMSPQEQEKSFELIQKKWTSFGQSDVWWSVLTEVPRSQEIPKVEKDKFYLKGQTHVDYSKMRFKLNGYVFGGGRALDFGCGVGRISFGLSPYFDEISCVDQSKPHLEIATKEAAERKIENVKFIQTGTNLMGLGAASFDFIFSLITLQHTIPPLQVEYLAQFCKLLKPGGIGSIQFMSFIPGYSWQENSWLVGRGTTMEMHAVPQQELFATLYQHGCYVIENNQKLDAAGVDSWDTAWIMFAKPIPDPVE